ncbi:hypothetical protein CEXT_587611 [Caerostris extrusa]|uniref:Uncharacterized protein n=1 Tax=Caerostris extrusa TaxID=172846 RepID=A0AAV4R1Y1_CAEEX|nr:hypothetical protein CEXT_587611 [Caerostris extrusa]
MYEIIAILPRKGKSYRTADYWFINCKRRIIVPLKFGLRANNSNSRNKFVLQRNKHLTTSEITYNINLRRDSTISTTILKRCLAEAKLH